MSPFDYDGTGVQLPGVHAPEGDYVLQVTKATETRTKEGNKPMVVVDAVIIDGPFKGVAVKYHNVTFLPKGAKGAGMALAWLKSIGEPWEGQFKVNAANWIGKVFGAHLIVEEKFSEKHGKAFKNNKIKYVMPHDGSVPQQEIEDVPF